MMGVLSLASAKSIKNLSVILPFIEHGWINMVWICQSTLWTCVSKMMCCCWLRPSLHRLSNPSCHLIWLPSSTVAIKHRHEWNAVINNTVINNAVINNAVINTVINQPHLLLPAFIWDKFCVFVVIYLWSWGLILWVFVNYIMITINGELAF